jgi:hypothetical protein
MPTRKAYVGSARNLKNQAKDWRSITITLVANPAVCYARNATDF